jgi:hypothetical protein
MQVAQVLAVDQGPFPTVNRYLGVSKANAELIAAAPEMLAALIQMQLLVYDMSKFVGNMALADYKRFNDAPIAADAAIAKATGGRR